MTQMETDTTVLDSTESTQEVSANWRDNLSDQYKESESLASFGSIDDLAKGFIETKAMVGANTVKIPGTNATDEQKSEFYAALGRPESHDKYEMPTENMPENFQPHEARLGAMQEAAFKAGLTSQQFAALVRADAKMMAELQTGTVEKQSEYFAEQEAALHKEYGAAFDEKIAFANSALQQFGGENLPKVIEQAGLGKNPELIGFLVKVGEKLADDEVVGQGGSRTFTLSPADAKAQISALNLDPEFQKIYMSQDAMDPRHAEAVEKMERLYKIANPV